MNRIALTLALTLLAATSASAQEVETGLKTPPPTGRAYSGFSYMTTGLNLVSRSSLNSAFSAGGFPTVSANNWSLGLGSQLEFSRWVFAGELEWVMGSIASKTLPPPPGTTGFDLFKRTTRAVSANAIKGQLMAGYSVVRTDRWSITPMLGIAPIFNIVDVHEFDDSDPSFGEVLDNPGRSTTLMNVALAGTVALGIDYRVPYKPLLGDPATMMMGLRLGYSFSPAALATPLETVSNATDHRLGFDGPFVKLVFGAGTDYRY
ncbi:MAG: hypothetical protein WBV82_17145 [Myxococcaceae bacterium]